MTPQEALQIIDQICASVQLNRADHQNVELALNILRAAVMQQDKTISKSKPYDK